MLNVGQKINYPEAQANLDELCNQVVLSRDPVIIEREGSENVALIAADELISMKETLYLLSSPENAIRLFAALEEVDSGTLKPQTLDELLEELDNDDEDEPVN
ncbi:type II toxin-antitoxin system Phd/YefM family antitoxin [Tolypothrix sp. FACHB-123]|uniref:type II toxin-antitoxin system Phd/YefM family antitoxin n=1 Tax=Tolypothrix sp. FACHB-123 TaxID=2692868 RepID=UPI001686F05A|nr:type II toxin-antitoxin system Phd/YefM family antitoxin [Tolypothrix sp. FACHB-123]MBD2356172.1 type II toxin-antitoxin system Phd/YefM family antitoxin [Tolypothrix sp. FACHB-123]